MINSVPTWPPAYTPLYSDISHVIFVCFMLSLLDKTDYKIKINTDVPSSDSICLACWSWVDIDSWIPTKPSWGWKPSLGRICSQRRQYLYKYNDKVDILPLAMVDDLLGIAPCGLESLALNSFINVQIEMKKLKFHTPGPKGKTKCHNIHVEKKNECCPALLVHGTKMPQVHSDT